MTTKEASLCEMLAQSLTSVWVLSLHSQVPAAGAAPYGDRVCAYPLLRPKFPESSPPPLPACCAQRFPGPATVVATSGPALRRDHSGAPPWPRLGFPLTQRLGLWRREIPVLPPAPTSGHMGPRGYGSTMLLFQEPPPQGTPQAFLLSRTS